MLQNWNALDDSVRDIPEGWVERAGLAFSRISLMFWKCSQSSFSMNKITLVKVSLECVRGTFSFALACVFKGCSQNHLIISSLQNPLSTFLSSEKQFLRSVQNVDSTVTQF